MTAVAVAPFASFDDMVVWQARRWSFVREVGGPNRGFWVEWIQRFTANAPGDSWCASFVSMILAIAFRGKSQSPVVTTAVCEEIHGEAKANGWLTTTPKRGDLYLYLDEHGHAHHVGIVTEPDPLHGIAGNTSEDGTSVNGDRVAEHAIAAPRGGSLVFVAYPRPALLAAA
jgi:hypothetical protein